MIDSLPLECRPHGIRGDCNYGNESNGIPYLFKRHQTAKVKNLISSLEQEGVWVDCAQGIQGIEGEVRLGGWSCKRRVIVAPTAEFRYICAWRNSFCLRKNCFCLRIDSFCSQRNSFSSQRNCFWHRRNSLGSWKNCFCLRRNCFRPQTVSFCSRRNSFSSQTNCFWPRGSRIHVQEICLPSRCNGTAFKNDRALFR